MYGLAPLMVVVWIGGPRSRAEAGRRPMQPASAGGMGGDGAPPFQSEPEAAFARGVGQGLDPPMIPVTGAVEGNRFDAGGLRLLGDRKADLGRGFGVAAVLEAFADVGLGGAGRGKDLRAVGAEQLRVQVLAGAQHRQARNAEFADMCARRLGAAQAGNFLLHGLVLRKLKAGQAFLASLRMMFSPAYLTPLPLYGSGGRKPRILAATSPTCCRSAPLTTISVCDGVAMVMPSGAGNSTGCEKPSDRFRSLPCMEAR